MSARIRIITLRPIDYSEGYIQVPLTFAKGSLGDNCRGLHSNETYP